MEYGCKYPDMEKARGGVALGRTRAKFSSAAQLEASTYSLSHCASPPTAAIKKNERSRGSIHVHLIFQSIYDWSEASNRMNESLVNPSAQEHCPAAHHASSSEQR